MLGVRRASVAVDMTSTANCFAALTQSKAMERARVAQLTFDDSHLAVMPKKKTASLVKHHAQTSRLSASAANKAAPDRQYVIVEVVARMMQ